jgi:hypothetical protein
MGLMGAGVPIAPVPVEGVVKPSVVAVIVAPKVPAAPEAVEVLTSVELTK